MVKIPYRYGWVTQFVEEKQHSRSPSCYNDYQDWLRHNYGAEIVREQDSEGTAWTYLYFDKEHNATAFLLRFG